VGRRARRRSLKLQADSHEAGGAHRVWRSGRTEKLRIWDGWAKYGPGVGSVVAHATIGVALIGLVAATPRSSPAAKLLKSSWSR
jgi:hypothetical protein